MFIEPIQRMSMSGVGEVASASQKASLPFADVLQDAVKNLQETQKVADQDSYNLAMGNVDDLASIMVNASKNAAAMELTTQLSTRIVNAYKEIMQMQV